MPRFPDGFKEEVRARTRLEEIVGEYVALKPKGQRLWGCCPFHNEKTASFSVNVEEQFYHCFGCHKGGDVFRFVMEKEQMEFPEAVIHLAERAHMEIPETSGSDRGAAREKKQKSERIYQLNTLVARYYHNALWTGECAEIRTYLYKRGLNDSVIKHFGLGAAPADGRPLIKYLRSQGFDDAILQEAGLINAKDGKPPYAVFRNRAIFPIINAQGKVIGFGGRAMGDATPKYLNSKDTPVYNKKNNLYGLNFARKEDTNRRLVLVEGYMDAISLWSNGVRGLVATLGTALTAEQVRLIRRYASEVWISYDGDAAGQKAALRALELFDAVEGITVRVIDYPPGQDPDDFIRASGLAGFEQLPRYDATEYRMLRDGDGLDLTTDAGKREYAKRCCADIAKVKSPIDRETYLRVLAQRTDFAIDILRQQVEGLLPAAEAERSKQTLAPREPVRIAAPLEQEENVPPEEQVLLTLLADGSIPRLMVKPEDFSLELSQKVAQWLLDGKKIAALLSEFESENESAQVVRAVSYAPLPKDREECMKLAESSLRTIRKSRLRARIAAIEAEIKTADPERKAELYRQIAEITKALYQD